MWKRIMAIVTGVMAAALLSALASTRSDNPVSVETPATGDQGEIRALDLPRETAPLPSPTPVQFPEIQIHEVSQADAIEYRGYVARKRYRRIRYQEATRPIWIRASHVVLERKGRRIMTFDANYYFGMGNSTSIGLLTMLGGTSKQLIASQDVNRGGAQWIVDLSSAPRLVFSSTRWQVGREVDDMGIKDLDGDGVYEITLPITDFYALQDKMSMSQIPLPEIVFKYDPRKRAYLPANRLFRDYLLKGLDNSTTIPAEDELNHRSLVLRTVLNLVYAVKRTEAWNYFDQAYKLKDKEEIRHRVKSLLSKQPVYNFIYTRHKRR